MEERSRQHRLLGSTYREHLLDTEQPFDLCLKRAGIKPRLIAQERNYLRHVDQNIDHARSQTGLRMYPVAGLAEKAEHVMAKALYRGA